MADPVRVPQVVQSQPCVIGRDVVERGPRRRHDRRHGRKFLLQSVEFRATRGQRRERKALQLVDVEPRVAGPRARHA